MRVPAYFLKFVNQKNINMIRFLCLVLFACATTVSLMAKVGDTFEVGNLQYEILSEEEPATVAVKKSLVFEGSLEVPAVISHNNTSYKVTRIGSQAFHIMLYWENEITDVTLPETIESIGFDAFADAPKLQEINLPSGLQVIEECAFAECRALKSIYLSPSIQSIGERAFFNCSSLQSVILPDGPVRIEMEAFSNCSDVKILVIPSKIEYMGEACFNYCSSLKNVYAFPESPNFAYNTVTFEFMNIARDASLYYPEDAFTYISWQGFQNYYFINSPLVAFTRINYEMDCGQTYQIQSYITGYNGIPVTNVVWESNHPDIATVDENGLVTAISSGLATITCTVTDEDGSEGRATFTVGVRYSSSLDSIIPNTTATEYFTLQGLPAGSDRSALAPGIYIRRQGSEVTKIIVK